VMAMGCAILWFGWFGFNGGSALQSGGLCAIAFFNTHLAASSAMITWICIDWFISKPTLFGACAGVVAGLVAVTPCAGFIQPFWAFLIGPIASTICWNCLWFEHKYALLDDTAGVCGVHGMAGVVGTILTGAFADGPACKDRGDAPEWCVNPGTITASLHQVWVQTWACSFVIFYSFMMTGAIMKGLSCCFQLSGDDNDLDDFGEHGEQAYDHEPPTSLSGCNEESSEDDEISQEGHSHRTDRSSLKTPTPRVLCLTERK